MTTYEKKHLEHLENIEKQLKMANMLKWFEMTKDHYNDIQNMTYKDLEKCADWMQDMEKMRREIVGEDEKNDETSN
jgi:hypothetical protein